MQTEGRELGFGALDTGELDALCLFVALDERPLTGIAGYVDWRLCGGLSRLIRGGVFEGQLGEKLLLPSEGRIAFTRIFAVGLGPSKKLDPAGLSEAMAAAGTMLTRAKASAVALEIPGAGKLEDPVRAAALTAKFLPAFRGEKVVVVGDKELLRLVGR